MHEVKIYNTNTLNCSHITTVMTMITATANTTDHSNSKNENSQAVVYICLFSCHHKAETLALQWCPLEPIREIIILLLMQLITFMIQVVSFEDTLRHYGRP